jgi:putative transposase
MPDYRRLYLKGGTYFFTLVTYSRQPVFRQDKTIALLKDCFTRTARSHPFIIEALVVLPDHLHTIWKLPEEDCDFSTRWNLIKGNFTRHYENLDRDISESRRAKREKTVWQRRFWEHLVRNDDEFNRLCDYIHYNPVKHGLVRSPGEWPESTFLEFVTKGLYPKDWGLTVSRELKTMSLE